MAAEEVGPEVEAAAAEEEEMVADSELVSRLREILRDSDLEKTTASSVRRQLQEDFGVDLSARKAFIRDQIDIYLQDLGEGEDADADDGNVKAEAEAEDEGGEAEDKEGAKSRKRRKKSDTESKRTGGFNKLCSLSEELQSFVGVPALARPQVVKRMWSYIKEKDLQDPKDKRKIICDDALYSLFRVKSINMFQMNKALARHIWPLNPEDENAPLKAENQEDHDFRSTEEGKNSAKEIEEEEKDEDAETVEGVSGRGRKKKRSKESKGVKKRGGGFTKVCSLSEQLQVFTGASELARTEVVKLLWNYIRENNLQDPSNKRRILCDESLRALFKVDAIDMFQMNKVLTKHIWPRNEEEASEKLSCTGVPCKQPKDEGEVGKEDNQQKGSSNCDSS